jgi:hypothetical protein
MIDTIRRFRTTLGRLGRTQIVWLSLMASMTGLGGLLLALDGERAPRLDGLALAKPVVASGPSAVDLVFETRADLAPGRWDGVVIHHSGAMIGSAADLATAHESRGLHGLGYHFVIGNGRGSGDGEIHVGYRWLDQLPGAHVAGLSADRYNRRYLGVCLIGDGDRRAFTDAQLIRSADLVGALLDRLGLTVDDVRTHRDLAATSSPGRHFPEAEFRERVASSLAERRAR